MTAIELYPIQGQFVGTSAHAAAFVGGIGSGKSIAGCARALLASQGYVGTKRKLTTPNLGVITAPTYNMLRDATVRAFFDLAGDVVSSYNKTDKIVLLKNGSEVLFRSTDNPELLRGPSVSWWFGDEAALCMPNVFDIMIGRLRQFGQRGYAWIATTPKGRNWVYQRFVQRAQADYKLFRARSADNRFLDPAIVEAWKQSYVGDFAAQELDGEFVSFEGLIYPEFNPAAHVVQQYPKQFTRVVAGVDWGFVHAGVITVVGVDYDGRAWLVDELYARQRHIDDWVSAAQQLRDTWHITLFACDPSEPDYIAKFRAAGLKAEQADNTVNTGIQTVRRRLAREADGKPYLLIAPHCVNTITEFQQYQWDSGRAGLREQPLKTNDHAMDSLRYALMAVDESKRRSLAVETSRYA